MKNENIIYAVQRYVFIDALRGIASLWVMFHHMVHNTVMEITLRRILPGIILLICHYGALGVQIFFVLSGFVIAHSLRDNMLTFKSVINFILRRQIRLDPPYWAMMVFVLTLSAIELSMPSLVTPPLPGFKVILLNLFYLQNITAVGQIIGVAWTLCIEIQFYLVFIALLVASKNLAVRVKQVKISSVSAVFIFTTGCLSIIANYYNFNPVWFFKYWFYFASGVLCYWSIQKFVSPWFFYIFQIIYMLSCGVNYMARHSIDGLIAGLITVLAIYIAGISKHLTDWWKNSALQYFGRISYSLYLVHLVVISIFLRVAYKITGENQLMALIWFVLSGVCSIFAAHLLFKYIEKPSMQFASKFKQ